MTSLRRFEFDPTVPDSLFEPRATGPHDHAAETLVCDRCSGRWVLVTASGAAHYVDLDARTVRRLTEVEAPRLADDELPFEAADLRKDDAPVDLVKLEEVLIEHPGRLWLYGVSDDPEVVTLRTTTPVVKIVRLTHGADDG